MASPLSPAACSACLRARRLHDPKVQRESIPVRSVRQPLGVTLVQSRFSWLSTGSISWSNLLSDILVLLKFSWVRVLHWFKVPFSRSLLLILVDDKPRIRRCLKPEWARKQIVKLLKVFMCKDLSWNQTDPNGFTLQTDYCVWRTTHSLYRMERICILV